MAKIHFPAAVKVPPQWVIPGLSAARDAVNDTDPRHTPAMACLEVGPSLAGTLENYPQWKEMVTQDMYEIVQLSATEIVNSIKEKQLTALQVIDAFLPMAALAHQATGCLSDFFPEEARAQAMQLDEKQSRGKPLGLLHGLPLSIKGHIFIAGKRNQNGFVLDTLSQDRFDEILAKTEAQDPRLATLLRLRGARTSDTDGLLVRLFREQGAVFYCKTTMPQSVMHLDTRSNAYGQTLSPWNLALSAGGSSGGEAALLASHGSPMGVGSDIGGSVRQPCAVNGLWGLRPTCGRVPSSSSLQPTPGNNGVGSTVGPMCNSLDDIALWMRAVLAGCPWKEDSGTFRLPWRDIASASDQAKPLRIGIMRSDGVVCPITPIRRALQDVIGRLESSATGTDKKPHRPLQLINVDPPTLHKRAWPLIRTLYYSDGGAFTRSLASLGNEDLLPLTQHILSEPVRRQGPEEIWSLVVERETIRKTYLAWWQEQGIDVLLCPATATVAPRPGTIKYWGYTSAFNLFDVPSAVFPTGTVVKEDEDKVFEAVEEQSNGLAGAAWEAEWNDDVQKEYLDHRQVYEGAPVGLQLVGQRFEEEELLQAVRDILTHLE